MGVPQSTVQEWLKSYDKNAITVGLLPRIPPSKFFTVHGRKASEPWGSPWVKTDAGSTRPSLAPTLTNG